MGLCKIWPDKTTTWPIPQPGRELFEAFWLEAECIQSGRGSRKWSSQYLSIHSAVNTAERWGENWQIHGQEELDNCVHTGIQILFLDRVCKVSAPVLAPTCGEEGWFDLVWTHASPPADPQLMTHISVKNNREVAGTHFRAEQLPEGADLDKATFVWIYLNKKRSGYLDLPPPHPSHWFSIVAFGISNMLHLKDAFAWICKCVLFCSRNTSHYSESSFVLIMKQWILESLNHWRNVPVRLWAWFRFSCC